MAAIILKKMGQKSQKIHFKALHTFTDPVKMTHSNPPTHSQHFHTRSKDHPLPPTVKLEKPLFTTSDLSPKVTPPPPFKERLGLKTFALDVPGYAFRTTSTTYSQY